MLSIKTMGSKNATVLTYNDVEVLFSYSKPVGVYIEGLGFWTTPVKSPTISKHVNAWLDERTTRPFPARKDGNDESLFRAFVELVLGGCRPAPETELKDFPTRALRLEIA